MKKRLFVALTASVIGGAAATTLTISGEAFAATPLESALCASVAQGGYGSADELRSQTAGGDLTYAGFPATINGFGASVAGPFKKVAAVAKATHQALSVKQDPATGKVDVTCRAQSHHPLSKEQQDAD
ncbi:hypothetical protein [Burkholderia pseudomallei]|uniref:hypothetical protein n=1 Tax=Burkholderia pseudomallei TaxID=28450 RepID=UPI000A1A0567|nr:hypothetical protein [Burkholderia pseudomallei]ARL04289.1 hypothetical protein BOC44_21205 [Burkholderia pseudomallei]